jgi:hypothetical protein
MTIERNNKVKDLALPAQFLEKVGMDIRYGHTDSPDGFKISPHRRLQDETELHLRSQRRYRSQHP